MPVATKAPTAAQGAQVSAAAQMASKQAGNLKYLLAAVKKEAICPPAAGAGINQTYVAGQTLIYDVPTANGAFLEELKFECNLTVNPATGAAATYALNAAAPWTLIDRVIVIYGNTQVTIRPFLLRILALLSGYERAAPEQVNAGNQITTLTSVIWGSPFAITTNTANPWKFWFRLPLRWILRSPMGMLPIMGNATRVQVQVVLASAAMGPDPILNTVANTGGTGASVAVAGTIQVNAIYRDGTNIMDPNPLALDLTGLPTIQTAIDRQLNPLTAGTILAQRFGVPLQHLYAISVVVDGVQSTSFALNSNIQEIELRQDFNGANAFYRYGVNGNNILVNDYFERFRAVLGQDLDQGIIPWVPGPAFNAANPDNQEGGLVLNMMPGGWTDASYGIQVGAVNNATITPRVETYLISVNPAGLAAA